MKKAISILSTILVLFLISFGCSSSDDSSVSNDSGSDKTETSFNFTMSSFLKQETASSSERQAAFTADQIMTGTLTATNTDDSSVQTFDWSIYLDEESFDVQSNKTIILAPGTYDFSLLLTRGDQQYAGTALGQAISDGTFDVPMTIRPVIGETVTDVSVVASLADFKFQYDPAELTAASLTVPQLGITVDGGAEQIFAINAATGISNDYINLPQGSHTIELKLYDGSLQKGRSISAQETVAVSAGTNITMDLVTLHGETTFALTEAGGNATFSFTIPAEVVDEAGGLGNLQVLFQTVGDINPLEENLLTLAPDGSGNYESSITLTNKQFDNIAMSLTFTEISSGELLGSCNQLASLSSTSQTVNCDLTLRRRAVVGGLLLATVGINVFNEAGEPVAGAQVNDGFIFHGITGSGTFGTEGYLKAYFFAGDRKFGANTSKMWGGANLLLEPLAVANTDITLDMPFSYGVDLSDGTLKLHADRTFYYTGQSPSSGVNLETDTTTDITKISADIVVDQFTATGTRSYTRLYLMYRPVTGLNATLVAVELRGIESDLTILGWAIQCTSENCSTYDAVVPADGDFPFQVASSPGTTHTMSVEYLTGTDTFQIGIDGQYSTLDVSGFIYFDPTDSHNGRLVNQVDEVDTAGDNGLIDAIIDNVFINGTLYDDFSDVNVTLSKWKNAGY